MNFYNFSANDNSGNPVSMKQYEGRVVLVVNTATKCGLTPQYEQLEALYEKYAPQGLEILDFPCNQFMNQAPGSDEEIQEFCTLKYNTRFPRFQKIDVNGPDAHPLFVWLKQQIGQDAGDKKSQKLEKTVKLLTRKNQPEDVKWNFGKFLINRNGDVIARYSPAYEPLQLEADIAAALAG